MFRCRWGDILGPFHALPPAPDAEHGVTRRDVIAERSLVELVNAGHYAVAARFADAIDFNSKPWANPDLTIMRSVSQRDALFCLAVLDSQQNEPAVDSRDIRVPVVGGVGIHEHPGAGPGRRHASACAGVAASVAKLCQVALAVSVQR